MVYQIAEEESYAIKMLKGERERNEWKRRLSYLSRARHHRQRGDNGFGGFGVNTLLYIFFPRKRGSSSYSTDQEKSEEMVKSNNIKNA